MFAILGSIFSFLNGGSVQSIASAFENIAKAKADKEIALGVAATQAERDRELKHYDFQMRALEAMAAVMIAEQGWWVTRMIRPAFAWLCIIHFGGIVLASWGVIGYVAPLPSPYDWLELGIAGSYFALRPFEKNARTAAATKAMAKGGDEG